MSKKSDFRAIVTSLWFRMMTLGIVSVVFAEALLLSSGKAQGWTFYLPAAEVLFEVLVRLVFAALVGIVLGTMLTVIAAPFLWHFNASRTYIADWATKVAVFLVVFLDSRYALTILIKSWLPSHGPRLTTALLTAHFLAFFLALCIPFARRRVVTSLDGFLGEKVTRRTAMATVAGAAALVVTEFAFSKASPTIKAALSPRRPKSNILLITFDAMCAEDMSLYGYGLPTTPNIDAFARKATTFTNFFSASTFTTSSVATMLTGLYPSECRVYQVQGRIRGPNSGKTLPRAMRDAGYSTSAFLSNSNAYYLAEGLENAYDHLPEPTYQQGGLERLWDGTRPLHQNSGVGSRLQEYCDLMAVWNSVARLPYDLYVRYPAVASFEHGRELLAGLPDGFFLWVHVMTPHGPYLPDAAERGRFIPANEQLAYKEEGTNWKPHYEPDQQHLLDRCRLRYDEFIATADRAFGSFMSDLEKSGKLADTTVIVSADHGESFEGGIFQHESPYQTRPVIHIPLIIRTAGQQDSRTVAFTADQTALAPTILEIAGQQKPDWLPGQSLAEWLNGDEKEESAGGLAFCQFLERNSVFRPLHHGTVGVIDGKSQYQYVLDIETQKGSLRPLMEAQVWNLDRSAENPEQAKALRVALNARFPELVRLTN